MKESAKNKILRLYPEYHTVYGPYLRKADGRKIVILYDGVSRSARQLAKVKLEHKLGRRLVDGEEVDHKDNDFTNDKFSNLQPISSKGNREKQQLHIYGKKKVCTCVHCEKKFKRSKSKIGPFCSYSCRSLHIGANQYGNKQDGYC